jgi:phosphoadenosine phosphosulfate reductase
VSVADVAQAPLFGPDAVEEAVEIIRQFSDPEKPYYLAFSGGKDSIVLLDLARRAGVPFTAHYADTTIDPPELRVYIRQHHADVHWERPKKGFCTLLLEKGLPIRTRRWCCDALKKPYSKGKIVLTGIRHAESVARRSRQTVSACSQRGSLLVNPILRWSTEQVWHYIGARSLPYCSLYDEGFNRIGCVPCPFVDGPKRIQSMARWPRIWNMVRKAAALRWERMPSWQAQWKTPDDVWDWWLSGEALDDGADDGQEELFA